MSFKVMKTSKFFSYLQLLLNQKETQDSWDYDHLNLDILLALYA